MHCIVIASGKGGVGRTTLTANLGIALAQMGKRTIIVDGSLTTPNLALLFKLEKVAYTLNDVLAGEATLPDVMYDGPGGVKIVPAAMTLDQIRKVRSERLPEVLREPPEGTDFLLIDVPGGLRRESVSALRAGHELLLITTPEMPAVSDALKTRLVGEFLGLKPIGVVLNRRQKEEFELTPREVKTLLSLPVLAEIPEDVNVKKALKHGKPVIELSPNSSVSKAIKGLAKKLATMKVKED
jgi:septum site-determining protein MinD